MNDLLKFPAHPRARTGAAFYAFLEFASRPPNACPAKTAKIRGDGQRSGSLSLGPGQKLSPDATSGGLCGPVARTGRGLGVGAQSPYRLERNAKVRRGGNVAGVPGRRAFPGWEFPLLTAFGFMVAGNYIHGTRSSELAAKIALPHITSNPRRWAESNSAHCERSSLRHKVRLRKADPKSTGHGATVRRRPHFPPIKPNIPIWTRFCATGFPPLPHHSGESRNPAALAGRKRSRPRLSGEGRNPETLPTNSVPYRKGHWIPAFAGIVGRRLWSPSILMAMTEYAVSQQGHEKAPTVTLGPLTSRARAYRL